MLLSINNTAKKTITNKSGISSVPKLNYLCCCTLSLTYIPNKYYKSHKFLNLQNNTKLFYGITAYYILIIILCTTHYEIKVSECVKHIPTYKKILYYLRTKAKNWSVKK